MRKPAMHFKRWTPVDLSEFLRQVKAGLAAGRSLRGICRALRGTYGRTASGLACAYWRYALPRKGVTRPKNKPVYIGMGVGDPAGHNVVSDTPEGALELAGEDKMDFYEARPVKLVLKSSVEVKRE